MPLTYTMDPQRNFADVHGVGVVTLDEAIHTIRAVAGDLAHNQCGCLVDVREMDYFPSVLELKDMAFEFIRLRAAFRCGTAFIVSNDKHYALCRFLASLVDTAGLRMAVFRDPEEAEFWLRTHTDAHPASA